MKMLSKLAAIALLSVATSAPAFAQEDPLTDEQCVSVANIIHVVASARDAGLSADQVVEVFEDDGPVAQSFIRSITDVVYSPPAQAYTPTNLANDFLGDCIVDVRAQGLNL